MNSASRIGTGKNSVSCRRKIVRVFRSADQNSRSFTICWNHSNPTHGLWAIAWNALSAMYGS